MNFTPKKINTFLFFNLPAAFITGVRVRGIEKNQATVSVTHRWVNKNPFKSLFWAVQGMAAELATGVLVMKEIAISGKKISMLVTQMNASFTKKATGKIEFECLDGDLIRKAIAETIATGEGQTVNMISIGKNNEGAVVSSFDFQWSVKLKG